MEQERILILDCGGQYAHLILRVLRKIGVKSKIIDPKLSSYKLNGKIKGVIISGGPKSVNKENLVDKKIFELNVPILGICYGHQWIAYAVGGKVVKAEKQEYGKTKLYVQNPSLILNGLNSEEDIWMSHSDLVEELPEGFRIVGRTDNCKIAAFENVEKKLFGLQFHPEVRHTVNGEKILRNFVFDICECKPTWTKKSFIESAIKEIKEKVGNKRAIIYLSGGVDSTVCAALGALALGKNLTAVYVNTGLMRKEEDLEVRALFQSLFDIDLRIIDAKDRFLTALKGITSPEKKRRVIADLFVKIFNEEAKKVNADFLIQGTIYPDRIESAQSSLHSSRIKTHHNVVGDIEKLRKKGKLIEPLSDLYKDEVREIGEELGIPHELLWRQPFPGPGLAIRIEGEVTPKKVEIVRKANHIVKEEIEKLYIPRHLWQYFAILTGSKAVGIKGDKRSYGYVIVVRIVESKEAMTANFSRISWYVLERISTRIINEIPEVTRVVYDITHKPPGTIEWE